MAAALVAALGSCVTGVDLDPVNPTPILESVQPTLLLMAQAPRILQMVGSDFVEGSEGTWNGQPRPTEFVSSSELRVTLDSADLAAPGNATVSVSTPAPGGGVSRALAVEVGSGAPAVDSVSPASAEATTPVTLQVRVFGRDFTALGGGSVVVFDGATVPTTFVTDSELVAQVAGYLLPRGATVSVRVRNPAPGGGTSAPAAFTVMNPVPVVTDVSPDTLPVFHGIAEIMTIRGASFVQGSVVWVDSVAFQPNVVTPTSLTVPVTETGRRGGRVWVENPAPGGGVSNEGSVFLEELSPIITYVTPPAIEEGAGDQSLEITGLYIAPDAAVTWNGDTLSTVEFRQGATGWEDTLVVTVPAALTGTWGEVDLRVVNPRGGGSTSAIAMAVVPVARVAVSGEVGLVAVQLSSADPQEIPLAQAYGEGSRAQRIAAFAAGQDVVFTKAIGSIDVPGVFRGGPGVAETLIFPEEARGMRLSADGQWVYFHADRDGAGVAIWRVRIDGTGLEKVVANAISPAPSPTRNELLYVVPSVNGVAGPLTILDLDTGVTTSLGVTALEGVWSPDGDQIAYLLWGDLYVIARDGTGDRALPSIANRYANPGMFDWSPDGRFVLGVDGGYQSWDSALTGMFELVEVSTDRVLRFGAPRPAPDVAINGDWRVAWYPNP